MLRLLGRVPHRFFFLLGAVQAVAVMAWWLLDLGARYAGLYAPIAWTVPPPWGHALLLTYTVFPFFMFGFLMTAMPNWTGEAMPHRAHLYAGLPMALGVVLLYVGFAAGRAGALGLAPPARAHDRLLRGHDRRDGVARLARPLGPGVGSRRAHVVGVHRTARDRARPG